MSKRILLIDSDEQFARSLQGALSGRGLTVLSANNSEQGMGLAKSERPDLIVVCVEAQPTNGYMLCTRLKKDEQLKKVPVVLISSNATADSFEKHKKLKTRAEEYLIKPFAAERMIELIGSLLKIDLPAEADGDEPADATQPLRPVKPAREELADEPLGLGNLVDEDEPLHLSHSEAAEARSSHPPQPLQSIDEEVDSVDVEEVLEEDGAPADDEVLEVSGEVLDEPLSDSHLGDQIDATEEDLDLLDAAFDALSPGAKNSPPPVPLDVQHTEPIPSDEASDEVVELGEHELAPPTGEQLPLAPDASALLHPDLHALQDRVHELEAQLIGKEAELEAARKGQSPSAELRKLKEARSKADKENVQLKEELNAKERELIELRDQQAALEHQAQTLQDDAVKREVAAKSLQQRAESLAAAAKKFERELGAAREELKSLPQLKAQSAEQESAHQELQKSHGELSSKQAESAARAAALEEQLAASQHEAAFAHEQLATLQGEHAKAQAELASAREAVQAAQREAVQARGDVELGRAEVAELKEEMEGVRTELAGARALHETSQVELAAARTELEQLRGALAAAQGEHEKTRSNLADAHAAHEATRAELAAAQAESGALTEARDELRNHLQRASSEASRHEQRATEAHQRINVDAQQREKARQALQSALQLLDAPPFVPTDPSEEAPALLDAAMALPDDEPDAPAGDRPRA